MSPVVQYATEGDIALVTLNNPPVNALSVGKGVVTGLIESVKRATADASIKAIVLIGANRCFSGGADISEFGRERPADLPTLRDLCAYLDTVGKPLICAVHGTTMGGGVETALACHYRIGARDAQLGLPEVKLGLVPGSGGTQRLPRLVDVAEAARIIVSGDPVKADAALKMGLLDEIASGDLRNAAIAFAKRAIAEGKAVRRVSAMQPAAIDAATVFGMMRARVAKESRGYPAPLACVDCIEAAFTKPFTEGLRYEFQRFDELTLSAESASLRHLFFAERAAAKIPDVPEDTPELPIRKAAVIGAGTMGGGIAMNFANAGIPVTMLEAKQEALDRGIATIAKNYANTVAKGRLTQDAMDKRMALIGTKLSYDDLADADIVIEAVFEDMAVKEQVFRKLGQVMNPVRFSPATLRRWM
jgi:3-hydroxyacyl-CoA dehydrogenase